MQSSQRRLGTLAGHFETIKPPGLTQHRGTGTRIDFDVEGVQYLLDHDNHDTRKKMKELMKDPLFIP
jgi:hypothetical protein